ncbi:16S rRNA (guanine(966)-N(2))-methyltransferase RsmD [Oleiagrimonas sp.]|uniref:16S rRNA (guanine(966)-N(2))-methyltransferase RsmD n=1 Tax=Oleiagrimonas sp. TaxID=2010330 RepID=UPI002639BF3F|nr:16S rRNA (guanine(966)-N(2))-methyltransferase RsmD [Oleiagrimonas sp.]MDA3915263.1 16S rRNA (guanine(966)-N(2))-methyltransferase RsmD [Oleiagrimonas sp.]
MKPVRQQAPGQVRIIGGSLRGSKLAVPDRGGLRPTPGRVRETLFNWLQSWIEGARCLDLFAGTGALGIEALSRGAAGVTFVERDAELARALSANLARLGQDHARVICSEAAQYLQEAAQPFDIVFMDPPFALELWSGMAWHLERGGWLRDNAWVHVESATDQRPELPLAWQLHRERTAGQVRHALYRRCAGDGLD